MQRSVLFVFEVERMPELVGEAIRFRRKELKLSQEVLALRADLARSYITELETGKRNLALRNVGKIAVALELLPSELFRRAGF